MPPTKFAVVCLSLPALLCGAKAGRRQVFPLTGRGIWSAHAVNLFPYPYREVRRYPSPDSKRAVVFHGLHMSVDDQAGRPASNPIGDYAGPAELLWAPDSSAFAITWSDGGAVGRWHTDTYLLIQAEVRRFDLTARVRRDFLRRYKCIEGREEPEIGATAWLDGAGKLLLIAEVPPHSSCPQMGMFMGYLVSVPSGRILKRYTKN